MALALRLQSEPQQPFSPLAVASPKRQPPGLGILDEDLLRCIIDYLPQWPYLETCMLVNKTLFALCLPRAYWRVAIMINEETEERYEELLSSKHRGVQHIRRLELFPSALGNVNPPARRWLKTFLATLDEGQLEGFIWHCDWSIPLDILPNIWTRQPRIRRFFLGSSREQQSDITFVSLLDQLDPKEFGRLDTLELVPNIAEVALGASKALEKFNVKNLIVDGTSWSEGDAYREEALDGESVVYDALTGALFDHQRSGLLNKPTQKWIGLRELRLIAINLRFCRDTWFAYLDLRNLDCLQIAYCPYADIFINDIMRKEPPQLKKLVLTHDLGVDDTDRTILEMEDFLSMSKGRLQNLVLHLRNLGSMRLDLASINRHRATLKHLVLDLMYRPLDVANPASDPVHHIFNFDDIEKLLNGCDKLSQLAIAIPPPKLVFPTGGPFHNVFGDAYSAILSNVNLTTLNLLNFPSDYLPRQTAAHYSFLRPTLERLVAHLFSETSRPDVMTKRLEILAFGTRERNFPLPLPKYFIKTTPTIMYKQRMVAKQVGLDELKREQMETDVLEYWLDFDRESRIKWPDLPAFVYDESQEEWFKLCAIEEQDARQAASDAIAIANINGPEAEDAEAHATAGDPQDQNAETQEEADASDESAIVPAIIITPAA